jgi:hypothetical protein
MLISIGGSGIYIPTYIPEPPMLKSTYIHTYTYTGDTNADQAELISMLMSSGSALVAPVYV